MHPAHLLRDRLVLPKGRELDAYSESHVGTTEGAIDNDSVLADKDVEARMFETKV